ncbi:MAG: hypothetical protein ACP5M1_07625 [Acidiphilium sp.]
MRERKPIPPNSVLYSVFVPSGQRAPSGRAGALVAMGRYRMYGSLAVSIPLIAFIFFSIVLSTTDRYNQLPLQGYGMVAVWLGGIALIGQIIWFITTIIRVRRNPERGKLLIAAEQAGPKLTLLYAVALFITGLDTGNLNGFTAIGSFTVGGIDLFLALLCWLGIRAGLRGRQ